MNPIVRAMASCSRYGLRGATLMGCSKVLGGLGKRLARVSSRLHGMAFHPLPAGGRELVRCNADFANRHAGQRCFVIGNGPSLRSQDLSGLGNEVTFVMSGFWKHPVLEHWQPSYYCFADPIFFDGSPSTTEFFRAMRERVREARFFVPLSAKAAIDKHGLLEPGRTSYLHFRGWLKDGLKRVPDLAVAIPGVMNVSQLPIMCALYMGCNPIYLLGMDHDWLAHRGEDRHFYEGKTLSNHVEANGQLARWSYSELMLCQLDLWAGYQALRDCATRAGFHIINATRGGFLDVFERQDFEACLRKL